jgi:hypothetical protein
MSLSSTGTLSGTPTFDGSSSFEIQALYKSKSGTQRYVLTIKARGSVATLYGVSTLDWGSVARTELPQVRSVAVGNTGDRPMTLTSSGASGPFALVGNTCTNVAPGGACSVAFQVSDTAPGDYGPLPVSLTGAGSGDSGVNLSVKVVGPLVAADTATALDFGAVTQADSATTNSVTWQNNGNVAMNLAIGSVPAPFSILSNTCLNVSPGASCATSFAMATSTQGAYGPATVPLSGGGAPASVSLKGQVLGYNLTASLNPVAFGTVQIGTPATKVVSVTNASAARAPISVGALTAPFSQSSDCGSVLEAGASCNVTVTYTPADATAKAANLTVGNVSIPVIAGRCRSDRVHGLRDDAKLHLAGIRPRLLWRWHGDRHPDFVGRNGDEVRLHRVRNPAGARRRVHERRRWFLLGHGQPEQQCLERQLQRRALG